MLGTVSELTWDLHQVDVFEKPQTDPVIGGLQMTDKYADRTIGGQTIGFRPVRTVKKQPSSVLWPRR